MSLSAPNCSLAEQHLRWAVQEAETRYPATMARPIRTVGILGAGFTGSRIAELAWQAGFCLVVADNQPDALERVSQMLVQATAPRLSSQLPQGSGGTPSYCSTPHGDAKVHGTIRRVNSSRLSLTRELTELAQCDLVLECVSENLYLKQQLLSQVEAFVSCQTILATNTSTIPLSRLAGALKNPARFCGIHFFMPILDRPVVEVVRGGTSSAHTLATAIAFVRRLERVPLVVEDGPGFLGNRLLFAWLNEAFQLVEEGYLPSYIDRQAQDFGWQWGPFALMDWIGLDVVLAGAWQLAEIFEDRLVHSRLLLQMVKNGQLGRKTGLGFYRYRLSDGADGPSPPEALLPNPDLPLPGRQSSKLLCLPSGPTTSLREQNIFVAQPTPNPFSPVRNHSPEGLVGRSGRQGDSSDCLQDGKVSYFYNGFPGANASWVDRLHVAILVEVEQMMQEGRWQDPRQVDVALVGALGFPAHLGGLLLWADRIGLDRLLQRTVDCQQATFRRHSAYLRLWERADLHKRYYPNCPELNCP
ncbi:MAG: 3-hydroxyacyl-CoA dehydrogenase [Thermoguttaceae bacterium]|nr:3-hydroxyacyl-CoA dehydrogenase [Thermoguttaceae bacterium]MDW8039352.1 3-hydroxyacyl-CoA dehydrogenase NAD-binding domain-containing protein [Thermoguttaceae bacterium]